MFIGKLITNGFLRAEAGGEGAGNGGGTVSLMAGAGAGGEGTGNGGEGDGGDGGNGGNGGEGEGEGNEGDGGASGTGTGVRYDLGDEAAMTAWREALGMNKEFAGEEFLPSAPEGLPEGVWDAEAVEVLGRKAWDLGVPKEAFAGIVHEFAARSAEAQKAAAEAEAKRVEEVADGLKETWGDHYDTHMKSAVQAVETLGKMAGLGADEVEAVVNDPVIGSHPAVIRLLAQMGAMLGDEGAKGLNSSGGAATGGRMEAERMMNDPSHPLHEAFMNPAHQNHKYADEQYNRLMGIK